MFLVFSNFLSKVFNTNLNHTNSVSELLSITGLCMPSGPCVNDGNVAIL